MALDVQIDYTYEIVKEKMDNQYNEIIKILNMANENKLRSKGSE